MRNSNNGLYYETKDFIINVKKNKNLKQNIKDFFTWVMYPFLNLFNKIIVHIHYKKDDDENKKKYKLVFCSIFKNEGPFLKEWLIYHKILGVEHFYLYNNNSTDNYNVILKPFIEEGVVTLIDWPQKPGQIAAYKHWYDNFRKDCAWCSFIDLDEFICPKYDYTIWDFIVKHRKYPVIKMDWVMFGSSGILKHNPDKLVIEQYESCWNKRGRIGKVLYNCNFDIALFNLNMPHNLTTKIGRFTILPFNDSGNICLKNGYERVAKNKGSIQMNHYYCKSYDILQEKVNRGSAAYAVSWKKMESYKYKEMNCINKDFTIFRYLQALRIAIKDWDRQHK